MEAVIVNVHGHHFTDQKLPMAIAHCAIFHTHKYTNANTNNTNARIRKRE